MGGKTQGKTLPELIEIRLDKWLWVARFFKTRTLCAEAVSGGKVHCNGERTKPGRLVKPGDSLRIRKSGYDFHIAIVGLAKNRLAAKHAQQLYSETEDSIAARELRRQQYKAEALCTPVPEHRPAKRERRQLLALKGRSS